MYVCVKYKCVNKTNKKNAVLDILEKKQTSHYVQTYYKPLPGIEPTTSRLLSGCSANSGKEAKGPISAISSLG